MAASRSSSSRGRGKRSQSGRASSSTRTSRKADGRSASKTPARSRGGKGRVADGLSNLVEQLANRIIKPLGLVVLSRERIQETLDDAAERGRLTRSDANDLVAELIRRGRQQTDDLLSDLERLLGRGRQQIDSAAKRTHLGEPLDRIARGAGRARRTVGVDSSFPIAGYDELTASQVQARLGSLRPAELRKVREYERRHANRKSVLSAIESSLAQR
jgi:polyhydroxyalkanoate synthesis regulator phasin